MLWGGSHFTYYLPNSLPNLKIKIKKIEYT